MRTLIIFISSVFFILSQHTFAQDNDKFSIPASYLNLQLSPSDKANETSNVLGAEFQYNFKSTRSFSSPINFSFHLGYQEQEYGDFSESRFTVGISANKYYKLGKNKLVNLGIKYLHYEGMGDEEEALDCIYCSNIEEEYSGGNSFFVLGINFTKLYLGLDYRLSDKNSEWSEDANDPYGLGPEYDISVSGIPDPDLVLNIGYIFR